MPKRRNGGNPRRGGGLVRTSGGGGPESRPKHRFPDALEKKTGELVISLNRRVRFIGQQQEAIAEDLLKELFANDGEAALKPENKLTPEYLCLRERAGKSLKLKPKLLYELVRVGALNRLRPDDDVWAGLEWGEKTTLLPLLGVGPDRRLFNAGVQFAAGPNVGVSHIEKWVQDHTKRLPGSPGRPRGRNVTLHRGSQFAQTGVELGDADQRRKFADDVKAAPAETRRELVRDLKKTRENLAKLLELIEDDADDE